MSAELEKQLSNKCNWINDKGQLYLIRCMLCPDGGWNGRENWAPSVAAGQCAWCGWKESKNES